MIQQKNFSFLMLNNSYAAVRCAVQDNGLINLLIQRALSRQMVSISITLTGAVRQVLPFGWCGEQRPISLMNSAKIHRRSA